MWMQAVAIILPRVQQHFSRKFSVGGPSVLHRLLTSLCSVPDNQIGLLSSTMFAGMMFGAVGWGTCTLICLYALDQC